jgi:DNA polymerase-1
VGVKGRIVVVLFDSNRATNPNVARDEARLAMALTRGGASVRIAELPHRADGEAWGPDDFLVTNGAAALSQVIASSVPADPLDRVATLGALSGIGLDTALAALLGDLPFLLSILDHGEGTRGVVEKKLKALGVSAKSFGAALNDAKKRLRHAHASAGSTLTPATPSYVEHCGTFCVVFGDEEKNATRLCNFVAHVDRELVLDNGLEETRAFEISGKTDEDLELPSITITPEVFAKEPWPITSWGTKAIVAADRSAMAHLRVAIQVTSSPKNVRVFTHLGFANVGMERVYLHAGGAVGAVDAEVRVGDDLARFRLPPAPTGVVAGIRLTLQLLKLADRKLGFLLIAVVFRAPLQSVLYLAVVVWLHGRSGSFKTAIAALLQAFFGDFDANNLPGSWSSTVTAIEELLFVAKDMLTVVDDFAPASADQNDPMRKVVAAIVRSIGNQKSRGRARANLRLRPNRPPRALVLSTAEDEPSGQSVVARTFPVELKREHVDLSVLSELQSKREAFKHVMGAYVQYLIAHAASAHLADRVVALREHAHLAGAHARLPDAVAHLTIGAEMFADFALSFGVLSESDAFDFKREAFASILDLAAGQTVATSEADPACRFLTVLRSLLSQRRVIVLPRRARVDLPADVAADNAFENEIRDELGLPGPRERIGWKDAKYYYLDPEAAYRVVTEAMRAAGAPMPISQRTLWERLRDRGAIVAEAGHHTVKRVCDGVTERVLMMPRSALQPDDVDPAAGSTSPPADEVPSDDDHEPEPPPPRPRGGARTDRWGASRPANPPVVGSPTPGRSTTDSGSLADSGSCHGPDLSGLPDALPDLPDLPGSKDRDHVAEEQIDASESTTKNEKIFFGRRLSPLGSGESHRN